MRIKEAVLPILATAALAAGCGSAEKQSSDPRMPAPTKIESIVQADCDQTPIALDQYSQVLDGGINLMQSLPNKEGSSGLQFESSNANVTALWVAKAISRNTAALAVAWTIESQPETNISVVNEDEAINNEASALFANSQTRKEICLRVVRGMLYAPNQEQLFSLTDKLTTYEPAYNNKDGQKELSSIEAVVNGQNGPVEVFNQGPIAGTPNQAQQEAIAHAWGITPGGDMVEVAYKLGNVQVSKTGQPSKVKPHGHTPVGNSKERITATSTGQGANQTITINAGGGSFGSRNSTGESNHPGSTPDHNGGPSGFKSAPPKSFGPGSSRGESSGTSVPTSVLPGPVRSPGATTTVTETAPSQTQTQTQTSTAPSQVVTGPSTTTTGETTTTTTTTTGTTGTSTNKGPAPCDPNIAQCN